MGTDIAGVVVALGPGVSGLAKGDKIYGTATLRGGGSGAFAQFAAAYVKGLGADMVIDAQKESFEKVLSGYEFVFDTVAGKTYKK